MSSVQKREHRKSHFHPMCFDSIMHGEAHSCNKQRVKTVHCHIFQLYFHYDRVTLSYKGHRFDSEEWVYHSKRPCCYMLKILQTYCLFHILTLADIYHEWVWIQRWTCIADQMQQLKAWVLSKWQHSAWERNIYSFWLLNMDKEQLNSEVRLDCYGWWKESCFLDRWRELLNVWVSKDWESEWTVFIEKERSGVAMANIATQGPLSSMCVPVNNILVKRLDVYKRCNCMGESTCFAIVLDDIIKHLHPR